MKTIERSLPFTQKTQWAWPDGDKKLVQVFEHVSDIDTIMNYVPKHRRGLCLQAGGAAGVWPYRFAQIFDLVMTFEALPENFECLLKNTQGIVNVTAILAPLSDNNETYAICNDIHERENFGAGYIVPDPEGIRAVRIDDLNLDNVDLIQLDIEGEELPALKGGEQTIRRCRPTIVLEQKKLKHAKGLPDEGSRWLEAKMGYKRVHRIHRDDILVPSER